VSSKLELIAYNRIERSRLPIPVREWKFHDTRKWRFDFAWPDRKLAVELEGGIWINGAHNRGLHFTSDCEKYNAAALLGWTVLRYTSGMLEQMIVDLRICLASKRGE